MKRGVALAVAAAAVAVAAVLLLLAIDVRRYEHAFAADDTAFHADPTTGDLWQPAQLVPFGVARRLLDVDEELAYRRAVRLFALGRPRVSELAAPPWLQRNRSEASVRLFRIAQQDSLRWRRSRELNMVGVLDLVSVGPGDPGRWVRGLQTAIGSFRRAIAVDEPTADDAKYNLEVALRLITTLSTSNSSLKGLGGAATQSNEFTPGY